MTGRHLLKQTSITNVSDHSPPSANGTSQSAALSPLKAYLQRGILPAHNILIEMKCSVVWFLHWSVRSALLPCHFLNDATPLCADVCLQLQAFSGFQLCYYLQLCVFFSGPDELRDTVSVGPGQVPHSSAPHDAGRHHQQGNSLIVACEYTYYCHYFKGTHGIFAMLAHKRNNEMKITACLVL